MHTVLTFHSGMMVSFRCKCICSFSSSSTSGKGYNTVSNPSCSSLPSAEGYHALSCAEWIAWAHL